MLKQRIITAIILIPIFLAVLFYFPPMAFYFLMSLITLGAAWEWTNLLNLTKKLHRFAYLAVVLAGMVVTAYYIPVNYLLLGAFSWWMLATILVILYPDASAYWSRGIIVRAVMGLFVLIPCWMAINYIRLQNDGTYSLLFLFILIWGADSAAYFVGRKWGKHKLAPQVSPGKSWEGFFGALVSSLVIGMIAMLVCRIPERFWLLGMILSVLTVVFSVIGDLVESMLKRQAGVKDSGNLLPGHGGLLDRIDSLTAAAPMFLFMAWMLDRQF